MPSNLSSEPLPEGFTSWREFNKAKKERKQLKQEYKIKKLEVQKQRELAKAAETTCEEPPRDEPSTLSIAVPGSILDNAQSAELRTYLAGQIARAACVFKVDEVIVYDDIGIQDSMTAKTEQSLTDSGEIRPARRCCAQLARILQYLECPQYLRKEFFPKHRDLDYAGLLNPLDAPHHMRQNDDGRFREGVVLNQAANSGCYVNVGLLTSVKVDRPLQPGVRVTVEMLPSRPESKRLVGRIVPPSHPQKETGIYWGYSVRIANSFNAIFTECPYKDGYDLSIGTSERGKKIEHVSFPTYQHVLVVFGGLSGIEAALEADDVLTVDNPALLFDHYLNTCPDQGSRTIRTEEAILITLAELRTQLQPKVSFKPMGKVTGCDDDSDSNGTEDFNSSDPTEDFKQPSFCESLDSNHDNQASDNSVGFESCNAKRTPKINKKINEKKCFVEDEDLNDGRGSGITISNTTSVVSRGAHDRNKAQKRKKVEDSSLLEECERSVSLLEDPKEQDYGVDKVSAFNDGNCAASKSPKRKKKKERIDGKE